MYTFITEMLESIYNSIASLLHHSEWELLGTKVDQKSM